MKGQARPGKARQGDRKRERKARGLKVERHGREELEACGS